MLKASIKNLASNLEFISLYAKQSVLSISILIWACYLEILIILILKLGIIILEIGLLLHIPGGGRTIYQYTEGDLDLALDLALDHES